MLIKWQSCILPNQKIIKRYNCIIFALIFIITGDHNSYSFCCSCFLNVYDAYVCMCVNNIYVHVEVYDLARARQSLRQGVFSHSPLYMLRQSLPFNHQPSFSRDPVSTTRVLKLLAHHQLICYMYGFWGSHISLHPCPASGLLASSQTCVCFCVFTFILKCLVYFLLWQSFCEVQEVDFVSCLVFLSSCFLLLLWLVPYSLIILDEVLLNFRSHFSFPFLPR